MLLAGSSGGQKRRGLLVRDLHIYQDNAAAGRTGAFSGEVYLVDSKMAHRNRSVPLTDGLCRELLTLCKTKGLDDPVFSISYQSLDYLWRHVRNRADLEHVRFKDLRAQISIYGEEAGIPLTVLARTMGHLGEAMTRRYQQRTAVLSQGQAEAIEQAMFAREHPGLASGPISREPRRTG